MSEHCLTNNVACIGWKLGAPNPEIKYEELRELISRLYSDEPKAAQSNYLGQIWPFIDEIQAGDLVVSPNYSLGHSGSWIKNGVVMVGVCTSTYHPSPSESPDGDNMRIGVDWKLTSCEVSSLGSGITQYLSIPRTVSWLDDNVSERFESLINVGSTRRYWWVNQNASWAEESSLGIVTAPVKGKKDQKIQHHLNVARIFEGDVILHYRKGALVAVSEALSNSEEVERPYSGADDRWQKEVNLVHCWYDVLPESIAKNDISLRMEGKEPFTKDGSVRQGYMFPLEFDFIERLIEDHEDRLAGTTLCPGNTFIFQGNPDLWDFDSYLETVQPGDIGDWKVGRYQSKNQMSVGDRVLFWKSGDESGIYFTGTLTSEPYPREPDERFNVDDENEFGIDYQYRGSVTPPLLKEKLIEHPTLKDLGIIKYPNATNYQLDEDEWGAIRSLLTKQETSSPDALKRVRVVLCCLWVRSCCLILLSSLLRLQSFSKTVRKRFFMVRQVLEKHGRRFNSLRSLLVTTLGQNLSSSTRRMPMRISLRDGDLMKRGASKSRTVL